MTIHIDEKSVFLTGAGVSVPSGLAAFRTGEDPHWKSSDTAFGYIDYFGAHPVKTWAWYLARFGQIEETLPNAAHKMIHKIQQKTGVHLITQNIDGLHRKLRTQAYEVHGSFDYVRCMRRTCSFGGPRGLLRRKDPEISERFETFLADPSQKTLPKCPACRKRLRPHVLMFDESYSSHIAYEYKQATRATYEASCLVTIGTTLQVGIAQTAIDDAILNGVEIHVVDPAPSFLATSRWACLREYPMLHVHQQTAIEFLGEVSRELNKQ